MRRVLQLPDDCFLCWEVRFPGVWGVNRVVADGVHIWVSVVHLGEKVLRDPGSWNDMTWGNIVITAMLMMSRALWFLTVGIKKVDDGKKNR